MSSTCTPRSSSAASVRVAYTAPLAPVIAIAIDRRRSASPGAIQRHDEHDEIENPDVAVQIERALHLREIVRRYERLLVREQRGDDGDAGEVDGTEGGDECQRQEAEHRQRLHR